MGISEPISIAVLDWRRYRRVSRIFGLSASPDGLFRSVFTGSGNQSDEIFTAQIRPQRVGIVERAWCEAPDLGIGDAWLEYTSIRFDDERNEVHLGVVVVSKREKPQTQPLLFKVEGAKTPYGSLAPVNPDMTGTSSGFGWAFEPGVFRELPDGSAVKEAYRLNSTSFTFSKPREIVIKLNRDVAIGADNADPMSIVTLLAGRFERACVTQ